MTLPGGKPQGGQADQARDVGGASQHSETSTTGKSTDKSQAKPSPERAKDDPSRAPESGDKPEAEETR
jgi:hypothetical protein